MGNCSDISHKIICFERNLFFITRHDHNYPSVRLIQHWKRDFKFRIILILVWNNTSRISYDVKKKHCYSVVNFIKITLLLSVLWAKIRVKFKARQSGFLIDYVVIWFWFQVQKFIVGCILSLFYCEKTV